MRLSRLRRHGVALVGVLGLLAATVAISACQISPVTIGGHLDASTGGPAAGVTVTVLSSPSPFFLAVSTVTDSHGDFQFDADRVPDGTYKVELTSTDWWQGGTSYATATPITVSTSSPANIRTTITPLVGAVAGTVAGPGSSPLSGVTVQAVNTISQTAIATTTSTVVAPSILATFSFPSLPAGTYVLHYSAVGYSSTLSPTITVGDGTTNAQSVVMPVESTMTGTVSDDTGGYGGEVILALTGVGTSNTQMISSTTSAADGSFTLHGLMATRYELALIDPTKANHTMFWGASSLDATSGPTFTPPSAGNLKLGTQFLTASSTSYAGQDLTGRNFAGQNLAGDDFSGANLSGANFSGANLTSANLTGATLTGVNFAGATLAGAGSGGLVGTPAALPTGWAITGGVFVAPSGTYAKLDTSANKWTTACGHTAVNSSQVVVGTVVGKAVACDLVTHTVTQIGTLPGDTSSTALSITDAGIVFGTSTNATSGVVREYSYDLASGAMTDLGTITIPSDNQGYDFAANHLGVIAMTVFTAPGGFSSIQDSQVFTYDPSTGTTSPITSGCAGCDEAATAINDSGVIVGYMPAEHLGAAPFYYSPSTGEVNAPNYKSGDRATDVNDEFKAVNSEDLVVGDGWAGIGFPMDQSYGFSYDTSTGYSILVTQLNTGDNWVTMSGLNDHGLTVGTRTEELSTGGEGTYAFVYDTTSGTRTDFSETTVDSFGATVGENTTPELVTNGGLVIGTYTDASGAVRMFTYQH